MRRACYVFLALALTASALAQPRPRNRPMAGNAYGAEMAAKNAVEQLAALRKGYENDLEVLRHLRLADDALADAMQPSAAIQKAFEEVGAADGKSSDFAVRDGVIRTRQALEDARRSPASADFGHLRSILRASAMAPASRVAIRNATLLEEEILAWLKVQGIISDHLSALTELSSESLKAAQRE